MIRMKKILALVAVVATLIFSGCSSKSLGTSESNAPKLVSAYLIGHIMTSAEVSAKLKGAGFEVLGTYTINKKNKLETVVFTNDALKAMANRPNRGFAALGRVLIDGKNNQISIANPVYFGKAFMQQDADYPAMVKLKETLTETFSGLEESSDKWSYVGLTSYHFMVAMPYYQDSTIVGEGPTQELLLKAQNYQKGSLLLFTLKLAEGKYLLGYDLSHRTGRFPEKIGVDKAGLLPYTILIENNEARIMAPKFYLAVAYPQLSMGQFMKIATVPGAIEADLKRPFE